MHKSAIEDGADVLHAHSLSVHPALDAAEVGVRFSAAVMFSVALPELIRPISNNKQDAGVAMNFAPDTFAGRSAVVTGGATGSLVRGNAAQGGFGRVVRAVWKNNIKVAISFYKLCSKVRLNFDSS